MESVLAGLQGQQAALSTLSAPPTRRPRRRHDVLRRRVQRATSLRIDVHGSPRSDSDLDFPGCLDPAHGLIGAHTDGR